MTVHFIKAAARPPVECTAKVDSCLIMSVSVTAPFSSALQSLGLITDSYTYLSMGLHM